MWEWVRAHSAVGVSAQCPIQGEWVHLYLNSARLDQEKGQQSLLSPLLSSVIQIWDELAGGGRSQKGGKKPSCPPQHAQRLSEFWVFPGRSLD